MVLANENGEEQSFPATEDWIGAMEKLSAHTLMRMIISKPIKKDCPYRKIVVEKKENGYQAARYTEKQVFHENFEEKGLQGFLMEAVHDTFLQVNAWDETREYSLLISKKGAVTLKSKQLKVQQKVSEEHNRKKNYILQEGMTVPPLVDMGIFTKEGKVVRSMYDKYKQINRFVELVDDVLKNETKDEIHILDFGCGKSYLTFVLYYYIVEIRKKKAEIIGLDLKADVIKHCNETAEKYGYDHLHFELGDINGYKTKMPVDMVVTLHACDTATDYALFNAVQWNAKYILSVPCCQHEVNGQIESELLAPMMEYGIIKERMAALATDAIRANMLTYRGYKTQILEFVDFAHSPKNLLIRAVKSAIPKEKRERSLQEVERMCEEMHIVPSIYNLLK